MVTSALAVTKLIRDCEIDPVYCTDDEVVRLIRPLVFLTNVGIEPVPYSIISNTTWRTLLALSISDDEIVAELVNCGSSVNRVAPDAFGINTFAIEPVPFSRISYTISTLSRRDGISLFAIVLSK